MLTTASSSETAERLAGQLVERRLAACVNILGPMRSVYRWKGAIERGEEYLLLIKTTIQVAQQLPKLFSEIHPYELPECIQLAVEAGGAAYLGWVAGEVVAK